MRNKWRAMLQASAGRHTAKEEATFSTQVKHRQEKPDEESKATCFSFLTGLKACAQKKDLYQVNRIHTELRNSGLLQRDEYLGSTLVSVYAKCGALTQAKEVFDGLPVRNVITWNALIAGYAQHGFGKEALCCFHRMRKEGLSLNAIAYACTLKACGLTQDLHMGERIHDEIVSQRLLEKHVLLGNALVDMYAKCGALSKARKVLDGHPLRNVVSWNALITGYAQNGRGKEALGCFHQMRREGPSPNAITYACTLKACGLTQAVDMGEKIHYEIASQGLLEKGAVLGGALVDMYAKCGALTKAQRVLDGLPVRNVITWNALIAGYARHGCGKEALSCFHQMQSEGLSPNAITYAFALKACGLTQDVDMGERIHNEIICRELLEKSVLLGGALVDMYAKCGALTKAQKVLDELPVQSVVSWSALIAGYAQHGHGKEALCCFYRMRREGLSPNAITYACTLKSCGLTQDLHKGERIHDEIASQGLLEKHVVLGNALVDMYAKCGALTKARKVLDGHPLRDVVSWNTMIAGYTQHGWGKDAMGCFHQMRREGLSPNAITYACTLKACGLMQDLHMGERIHDEIASRGLLEKHVVLGNALVDMYAKCGALTKARKVLDGYPLRDVFSWSTLIAGYAQHGCGKEVLSSFYQMRREGHSPNVNTYACTLKACSLTQDLHTGEIIHDEIASQGLLEKHVLLGGAMVDMYAKCGAVAKARKVLDELSVRNVVSWSALISGYVQHGCGKEAVGCFNRMRREGLSPDAITYACTLKACGLAQDLHMGERIHDEIASQGLLEEGVLLGGALVDMYAKCGALTKARKALDGHPLRDVVSWSALIAGYAQHGRGKEALGCFDQMRREGLSPNAITYACTLKACGLAQDVDMGERIHDETASQGLLEKDVVLGGALVNMYAKCGALTKAREVLDGLPVRNVISWNALIAGYAQHGCGKEALGCFNQMRNEGFSPDEVSWSALIGGYAQQGLAEEALNCFGWMQHEGTSPTAVTFLNVLNACSHSGLVDEAQMLFDSIIPDKEHYTCIVDLFGRARHFDKAMRVIEMMPSSDHPPVWSALLGACRKWGNVKLGRLAFERA